MLKRVAVMLSSITRDKNRGRLGDAGLRRSKLVMLLVNIVLFWNHVIELLLKQVSEDTVF